MVLGFEAETKRSNKGWFENPKDIPLVFDDHFSLAIQYKLFIDEFESMKAAFEFVSSKVHQAESSWAQASYHSKVFEGNISTEIFEEPRYQLIFALWKRLILPGQQIL